MYLLTGARSQLGRAVLHRLLDNDIQVRCLIDDPDELGEDRINVQLSLVDRERGAASPSAFRGVEAVVHLANLFVSSKPSDRSPGLMTWDLLRQAERNDARVTFVSSLSAGVGGLESLGELAATERAVLATHGNSVVAASRVISDDGLQIVEGPNIIVAAQRIYFPGERSSYCNPIAVADLADCIVAAVIREPKRSKRFEVGGLERMTHRELLNQLVHRNGWRRKPLHLPDFIFKHARSITGAGAVTERELALICHSATPSGGDRDARTLGVTPRKLELQRRRLRRTPVQGRRS